MKVYSLSGNGHSYYERTLMKPINQVLPPNHNFVHYKLRPRSWRYTNDNSGHEFSLDKIRLEDENGKLLTDSDGLVSVFTKVHPLLNKGIYLITSKNDWFSCSSFLHRVTLICWEATLPIGGLLPKSPCLFYCPHPLYSEDNELLSSRVVVSYTKYILFRFYDVKPKKVKYRYEVKPGVYCESPLFEITPPLISSIEYSQLPIDTISLDTLCQFSKISLTLPYPWANTFPFEFILQSVDNNQTYEFDEDLLPGSYQVHAFFQGEKRSSVVYRIPKEIYEEKTVTVKTYFFPPYYGYDDYDADYVPPEPEYTWFASIMFSKTGYWVYKRANQHPNFKDIKVETGIFKIKSSSIILYPQQHNLLSDYEIPDIFIGFDPFLIEHILGIYYNLRLVCKYLAVAIKPSISFPLEFYKPRNLEFQEDVKKMSIHEFINLLIHKKDKKPY